LSSDHDPLSGGEPLFHDRDAIVAVSHHDGLHLDLVVIADDERI
jgi:hypothetical protein